MKNLEVSLIEEYGYAYWLWYPQMNEEELVTWWKENKQSFTCCYIQEGNMPGVLKGVDFPVPLDYQAMIHEEDDSWLCINNEIIE